MLELAPRPVEAPPVGKPVCRHKVLEQIHLFLAGVQAEGAGRRLLPPILLPLLGISLRQEVEQAGIVGETR